jgi:hypothetical protein
MKKRGERLMRKDERLNEETAVNNNLSSFTYRAGIKQSKEQAKRGQNKWEL